MSPAARYCERDVVRETLDGTGHGPCGDGLAHGSPDRCAAHCPRPTYWADVVFRARNMARAGSGSAEVAERAARSPDSLFAVLVSDAGLYGKAFFGHRKTPADRAKLRRLWARALRLAAGNGGGK